MSENLTTTATVPRIIPPHPRYPGGAKDEASKLATKRAESAVAAAGRAERAERAVVAKLSEKLENGVLFAENPDGEFDFVPTEPIGKASGIFPGTGSIEKAVKWDRPAVAPEEKGGIAEKVGEVNMGGSEKGDAAKHAVAKGDAGAPLEKDGGGVEPGVTESAKEDGGEDPAGGADAPSNLSWIKRQRLLKPKPVVVSGEESPFNEQHRASRKKSFWARLRDKEKAFEEDGDGADMTEMTDMAKGTEKREGPAIESWVGEIEESVVGEPGGRDEAESRKEKEVAEMEEGPSVRARDIGKVAGGYRRPLFGTRKNLVAAVGLACALAFGLWVFWQYDGEAPMDADLVPQIVELQHTNSVHTQLSHFLMRYPFDDSFSEVSGWEDYDSETLGVFLNKNGSALELILSCLAEKDWEPQHQAWKNGNLGGDLPWADLARVKQAEALYLQRRGLEVGAFRAAFDLMEFGRKIQGVKAWPNYFLTGLDIYNRGLDTVNQLVDDTRMNSAQLGALQRTFAAHFPPGEDDLVTFYKASYGLEKSILEGESAPARPGSFPFHVTKPGGLLFKPNRTLTLFADAFSALIADASKPYYQQAKHGALENGSTSVLDSNRTGREYFAKAMVPYYEIPEMQTLSVAHHEAVKTMFALRRHGLDVGRLPDTLADLGATYLKDMPSDPFDGDTLRYSRVKKVVYSAGVDGVDSGGNRGRAGFLNKDEPTLEIPFSTGGDSEFH